MERNPRVAILGGGTVGGELVRLLQRDGAPAVDLLGVLVRDPERERPFEGWRSLVTTDLDIIDGADVVVEVMGGTTLAADLSLAALGNGARLVSANKAALAERWDEFLPDMRDGKLYFEAAVMAGTPVIGPLTGALRGPEPLTLSAVLNGTCNVVLAAMDDGADYAAALKDAQEAGFAEADPTLDVEGIDAAHKLSVLTRLVFDPEMAWADVAANTRGISRLTTDELEAARVAGKRVRLVGSVVPAQDGWRAAVRPVALPEGHPLLTPGAFNALQFVADPLGEVVIRGPGAGGGATASGVLSDLLEAVSGRPGVAPLAERREHGVSAGGAAASQRYELEEVGAA